TNRPAVIGLDDVVNGPVVGLHLVNLRDLLAAASLLPNRVLHVIGQVAEFNLVGVLQIDIAILFKLLIFGIVVAIAVALVDAAVVAEVAVAIAIVAVVQQLG